MFMQCDFKEGMKIPKGGFVQGGQLLVPLVDEDEDEDEAGAQLQRKLAGLNVSEITNAGPEDWRTRRATRRPSARGPRS